VADLFDTNILIDHLNGIANATRAIERSTDPAISTITWIEVMAGATTSADDAKLRGLLAHFIHVPLTDAIAEHAAQNRRQMRIKLPDAIILATARVSNRQLVTRNIKDFPAGTAGVRAPYRI
jgi:predicted nucleic acid-binding protein